MGERWRSSRCLPPPPTHTRVVPPPPRGVLTPRHAQVLREEARRAVARTPHIDARPATASDGAARARAAEAKVEERKESMVSPHRGTRPLTPFAVDERLAASGPASPRSAQRGGERGHSHGEEKRGERAASSRDGAHESKTVGGDYGDGGGWGGTWGGGAAAASDAYAGLEDVYVDTLRMLQPQQVSQRGAVAGRVTGVQAARLQAVFRDAVASAQRHYMSTAGYLGEAGPPSLLTVEQAAVALARLGFCSPWAAEEVGVAAAAARVQRTRGFAEIDPQATRMVLVRGLVDATLPFTVVASVPALGLPDFADLAVGLGAVAPGDRCVITMVDDWEGPPGTDPWYTGSHAAEAAPSLAASRARLVPRVGARALARRPRDGALHTCTVTAVYSDGLCDIAFEDGECLLGVDVEVRLRWSCRAPGQA